jgi:DNA-binding NtrC family response regulator
MITQLGKLQPRPERRTVITILAISPFEEDHASLREIFRHSQWKLYSAYTWREAFQVLERADISLVICERECPEGNWRELFERIEEKGNSVPFVVCSESPGLELWAEAVNQGAFDALAKPFDMVDVLRMVPASWQYYRHQLRRATSA